MVAVGHRSRSEGATLSKIGRNEPCPCGSGSKYKHCCQVKNERRSQLISRGLAVALVVVIAVAALALLIGLRAGDGDGAPPGQVWSEEHGHYHVVG